jgi:CBS domain-containing protein
MWWPAIGGLVVGIGGLFEPRALGVGYDIIAELLRGDYVPHLLIGLMLVKCVIWAVALGSGTSGGVLAPLLIMGGALGALEASFLPGGDARLWPLVGMAAVMGGTMRSPLTGVVFALELTYDIRSLLPLMIASVVAHGFTVLVMKRSILTEKVARRGHHVSREYSVDPLERVQVGQVMSQTVVTVPASLPMRRLVQEYFLSASEQTHQSYPVVDQHGNLRGIITKANLLEEWFSRSNRESSEQEPIDAIIGFDLVNREPITAYCWESCRTAAERMALNGIGRLVVVDDHDPSKPIGFLTRSDLLSARAHLLEEEHRRERFIGRVGK